MNGALVVGAHLGHWYVGGPIYLSPVIGVWAFIKWSEWRQRRRDRAAAAASTGEPPPR
jgi:hypothetical protein